MLKFIIKIIVVILLILGVANYANYVITGKTPDISIDKPSLPKIDISKLTDSVREKIESVKKDEPAENTYLYKWRDANGVIHYTSKKPADNPTNVESIEISNDTNVVPSVPTKKETPVQQQSPQASLPAENPYSPEGVKQLINQAKDIQNLMDERAQQQENIINRQ